jgi:hypothetical protein
MTGQLPAALGQPKIALPTLVTATGERASIRFLEFFAANIRNPHSRRAYAPPSRNFSAGPRASACDRSPMSSRCMSRPGSRPARASWPRRASSNGWLRSVTYSIGSSTARSCRSTRPVRCTGSGTLSPAGKRRCSIPPRRGAARQHRHRQSCRSARSRADRKPAPPTCQTTRAGCARRSYGSPAPRIARRPGRAMPSAGPRQPAEPLRQGRCGPSRNDYHVEHKRRR